jgi:hypothetical protein
MDLNPSNKLIKDFKKIDSQLLNVCVVGVEIQFMYTYMYGCVKNMSIDISTCIHI